MELFFKFDPCFHDVESSIWTRGGRGFAFSRFRVSPREPKVSGFKNTSYLWSYEYRNKIYSREHRWKCKDSQEETRARERNDQRSARSTDRANARVQKTNQQVSHQIAARARHPRYSVLTLAMFVNDKSPSHQNPQRKPNLSCESRRAVFQSLE